MASDHDRLEQLPDGSIAFRTTRGERWTHRDVEEARTGPGYRLFTSENGEERRYVFGAHEPHDATLFDLRDQLSRATPVQSSSAGQTM